jgi:NAD(P)-dependent dehydrogenase (short-subunit alcohol dehydrogenase family)
MGTKKRRRTVIVTGAHSGLGRATAILLGERGHRVLAVGKGKKSMADLPRETGPGGLIEVHITPLDSDEERVEAIGHAIDLFGGFDALVTSSSRGHFESVEEISERETRQLFDLNFFGPMRLIQMAIPHLREARSGTILCVSSAAGRVALPMSGAYCATQHALEGLCDTLRLELSIFGINVVLIEPSFVRESIAASNATERRSRRFKPPGESSPYFQLGQLLYESMEELAKKAASPTDVAKLVNRALSTEKPKPRYAISRSAAVLLWAKKVLPDRFVDGRLAKAMGLKSLE